MTGIMVQWLRVGLHNEPLLLPYYMRNIYFYFMCKGAFPECMCIMCRPGTRSSQKVSSPLGLGNLCELPYGLEILMRVLRESNTCS